MIARIATLATALPALLVAAGALADPALDSTVGARFKTEHCLDLVTATLGGQATHLEFESRDGAPVYEFVVEAGEGVTYYAACDGTTGALQDVDLIVPPSDPRFTEGATVDARRAGEIALARYRGEIEEVKAVLTQDGRSAFEVDVELGREVEPGQPAGSGELNVWVDARTGQVYRTDVEYWEIGSSTGTADDADN